MFIRFWRLLALVIVILIALWIANNLIVKGVVDGRSSQIGSALRMIQRLG